MQHAAQRELEPAVEYNSALAMDAAQVMATLTQGDAEARETAYASIEQTVRSGKTGKAATAFAVACTRPLIETVLCAPAARVAEAEWQRTSALLYEVARVDMLAVGGEMFTLNSEGVPVLTAPWTAPDTAFASMLAKEPTQWARTDAILTAVAMAPWSCAWAAGCDALVEASAMNKPEFRDMRPDEVMQHPMVERWSSMPFFPRVSPSARFAPLALLCLELVREAEVEEHPEAVITGAWLGMCHMSQAQPLVGKAVYEAGMLDDFQKGIHRWNPLERIGKQNWLATSMLCACKDVAENAQAAGVEVTQALLDVGVVDIAISSLQAYQMLGKEETSVLGIQWGVLFFLEILKLGSPQAKPVVDKLRNAGVDAFRFLLDNPLFNWEQFGMETGVQGAKIAALVWGKSENEGLTFSQRDIDKIVQVTDPRGTSCFFYPMREDSGQSILSLAISDINKELLIASPGFISVLVDSLLLDPQHPQRDMMTVVGKTDFEAVKGPMQRVRVARVPTHH